MCLIPKDSEASYNDLRKRIDKDIYVVKLVSKYRSSYRPYYQGKLTYEVGKLYRSRLGIYVSPLYYKTEVHEGLHAFYDAINTRYLGNTFYFDRENLALILCKIPKGSSYVLGTKGEIVTTRLIFEKVIFDSKKYKANQTRKSIKTASSLIKQGIAYVKQNYPNNNLINK